MGRITNFHTFRGAYLGMDPLEINNKVFYFYSYIVFPYKKNGDLVDLFSKASAANI